MLFKASELKSLRKELSKTNPSHAMHYLTNSGIHSNELNFIIRRVRHNAPINNPEEELKRFVINEDQTTNNTPDQSTKKHK